MAMRYTTVSFSVLRIWKPRMWGCVKEMQIFVLDVLLDLHESGSLRRH
jgi:hypothetical protein